MLIHLKVFESIECKMTAVQDLQHAGKEFITNPASQTNPVATARPRFREPALKIKYRIAN